MAEAVLPLITAHCNGGKQLKITSDQAKELDRYVKDTSCRILVVRKDQRSPNGLRFTIPSDTTTNGDKSEGAVVFVKIPCDDSTRPELQIINELRERISELGRNGSGVVNVLNNMHKHMEVPTLMESMKPERGELLTRVLDWIEDSTVLEHREEKDTVEIITVLKAKEQKIRSVIKICDALFSDIEGYHEARKTFDQLANEVSSEYQKVFREWCHDAESIQVNKDRQCIEIDSKTQDPVVTFDYRLVKMSQESRRLRSIGFTIPSSVTDKESEVSKYGSIARELREIVNFYCTVGDQILLSQKPLLIDSATKFTALLESRDRISWSRDPKQLRAWVEQLRMFTKTFSTQNQFLRNKHYAILHLVAPLFDKPPWKWRVALNEVRAHVHEVDEKFSNTTSWKLHWDHQLYKLLEYHFNDALLKADSWLGSGASSFVASSETDLFRVDLCFVAGNIIFRPSIEEIKTKMFSRIKNFLSIPAQFRGLVEYKNPEKDSIFIAIYTRNFYNFPLLYSKADEIINELKSISDMFQEWTCLNHVIARYGNNSASLATFLQLDTVDDYHKNLMLLKEKAQQFHSQYVKNEILCESANIIVNLAPIKSSVEWLINEMGKSLIQTLKDRTEFEARELKAEMSNFVEKSSRQTSTTSELKEVEVLLLKDLPAVITVMGTRCRDIAARTAFLKKWSPKMAANVIDVSTMYQELQTILNSRDSLLESLKKVLKSQTEMSVITLNESIARVERRWTDSKPEMKNSREFIEEFKQEVEALVPEFEEAKVSFEYSDLNRPKCFDSFDQLIEDVRELDVKLNIINEFEAGISNYLEMEWIVSRNKLPSIEHYINKWEEDHPKCGPILEARIKEWKELLPILKMCRGECFARVHWSDFLSVLEMPQDVTIDTLTLSHLVSKREILKTCRDFLKDLNGKAVGETSVRETFNELDQFAASAKFSLFDHVTSNGTKMKLIKDWRVIINQISESILTLQSLKTSEYFSNEFAEKSQQWETRLTMLDTVINLLNCTQRKWTYLEPIHAKNQRGSSFTDQSFASASREFLDIMRSIEADPHVIRLLRSPNLNLKLKEVDTVLVSCQKKLSLFMEKSRSKFPRFYFLADDDLLLVLAGKSEVGEGALLKKLFNNNLVKLHFSQKLIVAIESPEGEVVPLLDRVSTDTDQPETWLLALEKAIKNTLLHTLIQVMSESTSDLLQQPVSAWTHIPSQVLSLCQWIRFTHETESAIKSGSLRNLKRSWEQQLSFLTNLKIDGSENVLKIKVKSLVLDTIHFLAVIEEVAVSEPRNEQDWKWQKHLRYYYGRPSSRQQETTTLTVSMGLASSQYSFEYLGCHGSGKLVHTPLTDKCYLTCMQALSMGLGGNPYGPAGTGKTETVKALGQQLGRQVLVFNCDEAIDVKAMTRILVGLIKCGAWGCFDEFNRLNTDVLSALSSQIHSIQSALKNNCKTVELPEFGEVEIDKNTAVFITLNPMGKQYKGRNRLPDNLKALFLPVAMTVPDNVIISRVLLLSEGFELDSSKLIGEKITAWFDLAKNTMTRQNHYDWGLRAIKSCLNSCGRNLKSSDTEVENQIQVVVNSLKHQIKSKLVEEDGPRFDQLINDVFRVSVDPVGASDQVSAFKECIFKVMERNSLIPDAGQAAKIMELDEQLQSRLGVVILGESGVGKSTLWKTLIDVRKELNHVFIEPVVINPKAMHRTILLGHIDEETREWQDGVLPFKAREISRAETSSFYWLIFDGDIDPEWVEALNSVLDDNQVLTLPSGERIDFDSSRVNLLFEVTSLKFASPATISRLGVISVAGVKDEQVIAATLAELNFPTSAEELTSSIKWPQPKLKLSDAKTLLSQIRFSLTNRKDVNSALKQFQGGSGNSSGHRNTEGGLVAPIKTGNLVVTLSVSRTLEFMNPWLESLEPVLMVGGRGVGKHTILKETLFQCPSSLLLSVYCCPQTTPTDIIQQIRKNCTSVSSGSNCRIWRASNASKLILYAKNLELLRSDKWSSNPVIAFLVSLLSYDGFYDEVTFEWNQVQNMQLVATCTNIDSLDLRFLNRVHVCEVTLPPIHEIEQIIQILCPPSASWKSSLASIFGRQVEELSRKFGEETFNRDVDVMRLGSELISILSRYENPDDKIILHETRKILWLAAPGDENNSSSSCHPPDEGRRILTHSTSFGGKFSRSAENEMRQLIMKYSDRWINELEVSIPKIGLTTESVQVFAESSIFLSDSSPGLSALVFLGHSASGRKLSLKVWAHAFNFDVIWYPKSKLSEKHLLNELKNFTESGSSGEQDVGNEHLERKILILLDQMHFQQIPSLLKHIYNFIRENQHSTSSNLVIKLAIIMSKIPDDETLIWPRVCRVRIAPALSEASLIDLPTLLSEQIQPDFAPNFSRIFSLFPDYCSNHRRYLSFIFTFNHLMSEKKREIDERREHLKVGVTKLDEASREVEKLKEEAAGQRVILAKKRQEADEALQMITSSMEDSEDQKLELEDIRKRTEKETAKLKVRKAEIDEELKEIEPTLLAAKSAVGGIKSEALSEIRSLRAPPEVIRDILEGVLRLMGVNDTSWISMKSFLARRGVKDEIINFDARKITPEMRVKVQALMAARPTSFEEKVAKRASAAAAPLAAWVSANLAFSQVLHKIKPLEDEQNKLESGLKSAMTRMKSLSNQLEGVETHVGQLKDRLNQVTIEAAQIEVNLKQTSQTLSQSEALVGELSGEFERWKQQLKDLDHDFSQLAMRCLVSSALITLMGKQKSPEVRRELIKDCCQLLQVPLFDPSDFLGCKSEEEAFIKIPTPFLTPLIVDPTRKIIATHANKDKIEKTDLRSRDWQRILELGLRFGKTVLIEEFNRMELPLLSILKQQMFGSDGTRYWTYIGEKRVDLNHKFKLLLLANEDGDSRGILDDPLFNVINLAPSGSSTAAALLSLIISVRAPELEEKKLQLLRNQDTLTEKLKELERQLLSKLISSSSSNLLNDHQLISSLKETKSSSKQVLQSLSESAAISRDLDQQRSVFEDLAHFSSRLFFALQQLSQLNHCYRFGMAEFERLFVSSLEAHPQIAKSKLLRIVYDFALTSLFPDDKLIFKKFCEKTFAEEISSQSMLHVESQGLRNFIKDMWYKSKSNYILILTSPGSDPIAEIKQVVSQLKMDGEMVFLSMGADVGTKDIEEKLGKNSNLCISNLHLVVESLPKLSKILQDWREARGVSKQTLVILITEGHELLPNNLLETFSKFAYQSPPGLMQQFARLTDSNSSVDVKRLALLHSVCCERRHFVPLGWTKFYEFGFVDFRSSLEMLQLIKEKKERRLQIEFVRGILGQVIYGGKLDVKVDEKVLHLLIKRWFNSLDGDLTELRGSEKQDEVGLLDLPMNVTKWNETSIDERVSKGLRLLEKTGLNTALVREEVSKLQHLWQQLNPLARFTQTNWKSFDPTDPVLQMILSDLQLAFKMVTSINEDLRRPNRSLVQVLAANETPENWLNMFESGPERADHFVRCVESMTKNLLSVIGNRENKCESFNLSHFFRPAALLNSLRQRASRDLNVPIDETKVAFTWSSHFSGTGPKFTICGLILEGAVFEEGRLVDCKCDSPLRSPLPPLSIFFTPMDSGPEEVREETVSLPIFASSSRESIITFVNVPCRPSSQDHWIKCSAAIVIR